MPGPSRSPDPGGTEAGQQTLLEQYELGYDAGFKSGFKTGQSIEQQLETQKLEAEARKKKILKLEEEIEKLKDQ